MKSSLFLLSILFIATTASAQGPEITTWILNPGGETGYNGIPSNCQGVWYTTSDVYVSCTCIPGYDIGPWAGNPNEPANQDFTFKITRAPQENTGNDVLTGLGHIGVWSNGVSMFNPKDAFSYNNGGIWNQNAIVVEGGSFDLCLGHPAPNGEYHNHLNPTCLYDDTDTEWHSPIIGYAFDGFPVYGAYGYGNTDGTGPIVRMESSYQLRDITQRHTLADGTVLVLSDYGPDVSNSYPLGYYIEDYEYVDGLGHLDIHNGRWCVTPEYPDGTYCYFVTIDADGAGIYPYIIGPSYYGIVQSGNTGPQSGHNNVPGDATEYTGVSVAEVVGTTPLVYFNGNEFVITGDRAQQWMLLGASGALVAAGSGNDVVAPSICHGVYLLKWATEKQVFETKIIW